MLQREHSAILFLTFMKVPIVIMTFVLSIFEWPFYTGFTVLDPGKHPDMTEKLTGIYIYQNKQKHSGLKCLVYWLVGLSDVEHSSNSFQSGPTCRYVFGNDVSIIFYSCFTIICNMTDTNSSYMYKCI